MRQCVKNNISMLLLAALASWGCTEKSTFKDGQIDNNEGGWTDDEAPKYSTPHEPPPPQLWFAPVHLSTNVADTALKITVSNVRGRVDDSHLESILKDIRLTDAQSSEIGFQPLIQTIEGADEMIAEAVIQIMPNEPLQDGWHVLSLDRLPEGFGEPMYPAHMRSDDGSLFTQFRADSWPMLWGVLLCEAHDGTKVILEMSEYVKASDAFDNLLTMTSSGRDLGCKSYSQEELAGHGRLYFICPHLSDQDKVTIEIYQAQGLVGLSSGIALQGPLVHHFVVGALEDQNGCKLYRGSAAEQ